MAEVSATSLIGSRSNVQGISWPPLFTGQRAAIAALLNQFELSQWLTYDEIHLRQKRQLTILATHFAKQSPAFRARLAGSDVRASDIASSLSQLSVLSRRNIQDAGPTLFADNLPLGHGFRVSSRSSGSTGEPVEIQRTWVNYLDWMALTLRGHQWYRRDFSRRHCSIFAGRAQPIRLPHWKPPVGLLFDSADSWSLPVTMDMRELAAAIEEFRPGYLLTYPSVLIGLMESSLDSKQHLSDLNGISVNGELLTRDERDRITAFFGAPVTDMYGAGEVGLIAQQCPQTGLYHINAETLLVEVLAEDGQARKPGEVGRIVVSDLRNFATPIIRYELGDYVELGPRCSCGRGLPTLARILGRKRNLLQTPDGRRFYPQLGFGQYRQIAPIRQYQLIQFSKNEIEVRIVVDRPLDQIQKDRLSNLILNKLRYPFKLKFSVFSDRLPLGKSGKFEEFIQML